MLKFIKTDSDITFHLFTQSGISWQNNWKTILYLNKNKKPTYGTKPTNMCCICAISWHQ